MTSLRSISRPLLEPESLRLQNDIESLTKAVGLQQRRTASLDERVQFYSKEIKAKRDRIRAILPSDKAETRLRNRLTELENRLQRETVILNKDLVENQRLRDKIDSYRRDKCTFLGVFREMRTESSLLADQAQAANKAAIRLEEVDDRLREQLVKLKQRSESALGGLQSRMGEMQEELEGERRASRSPMRADWITADSRIFYDNNQILKSLYAKWSTLCKDQKKAVDQYNRSVQYLFDAFHEIKEATGIGRIGEMVIGLIKAQEQEKLLLENLNKVMAVADGLEMKLKELQGQYEDMVKEKKTSVTVNEEHLTALHTELSGLRTLFQRKVAKQARLRSEVESLDAPINSLLTIFQQSLFRPSRHKAGRRQEDISQKLGRLEKEIVFLLKYLSLGKGDVPAALELELRPKDFEIEGKGGVRAQLLEEPTGKEDSDVPLTALELRRRAKLKFSQMQE